MLLGRPTFNFWLKAWGWGGVSAKKLKQAQLKTVGGGRGLIFKINS